MNRAEKGN